MSAENTAQFDEWELPIGTCADCGAELFADEDDGSGCCTACQWEREEEE